MMICNFLFAVQAVKSYRRAHGIKAWGSFAFVFVVSILVLIAAVILRPQKDKEE